MDTIPSMAALLIALDSQARNWDFNKKDGIESPDYLPRPRRSLSRRALGGLGILLLKLGMWLKQFEQPPTTPEEHV